VKICFLLNDLQLSGGITVVLEHARRLSTAHDMDVTLVRTNASDESWSYPHLRGLDVKTLGDARELRFDVAIATWWETVYALPELEAARSAYFVQSLEDRFYQRGHVERFLAAATHDLPLSFITEANWIKEVLGELQPETPCFYVRNGIAKDIFVQPPEPPRSDERQLRVLVEGNPTAWFKGVRDAADAVRATTMPIQTTLVTPARPHMKSIGFDRVVGPLSHEEMAAAYAETDVVLKLSRVEGMFGPPLEGFHRGATAVVTPVTGHDEYVVHGWNAVVVDWDDPAGTARWLDLLATDRGFLDFLRRNALATARAWPSWDDAAIEMARALKEIRSRPQDIQPSAWGQLARDAWSGSAELRRSLGALSWDLQVTQTELKRVEWELEKANLELRWHQTEFATRAIRTAIALRLWKAKLLKMLGFPLRAIRSLGQKHP
jgi:O-antigen biosynthesis protein